MSHRGRGPSCCTATAPPWARSASRIGRSCARRRIRRSTSRRSTTTPTNLRTLARCVAAASSPSKRPARNRSMRSATRTNRCISGFARTLQPRISRSDPTTVGYRAGRPGARQPRPVHVCHHRCCLCARTDPGRRTYTVNTTLDDLKAAGLPPGGWIPENWGNAVFVFDRSRFATNSRNDLACVWAYGRYTVDGDTLTWDYEDGGGKAPNNAINKPGEEFGFNWSLYR